MVATESADGRPDRREGDLLRGVLDMCVLGMLALEPTHAYDVVERLRRRGFTGVGYGTVYPLVTRLRRQGLVTQDAEPSPHGPPRQLLSLTAGGHEALLDWRQRWERTARAVSDVLADLDGARIGRG